MSGLSEHNFSADVKEYNEHQFSVKIQPQPPPSGGERL